MANEYLKRTPTSTGNRKVFTWSGWIKYADPDANAGLFGAFYGDNSRYSLFRRQGGYFQFFSGDYTTGSTSTANTNTWDYAYRRDTGSWMHVMYVQDTTKLNGSERTKIYVNGEERSTTDVNTPALNSLGFINSTNTHYIGNWGEPSFSSNFHKGEMFDVFSIDGQALTPDVFGYYKDGAGYISVGSTQATSFKRGQWVPKKPSAIKAAINAEGGFGVNGFYLPINDASNMGADFHCEPNSIITLKGENNPQPRNGAPDTTDSYVSQLRTDPYAANLVLAVPGISGGTSSGYGDYSADIKGSGSNKTITANGNAGVAVTASYYGSALSFTGVAGTYFSGPTNDSDFHLGSDDFTVEAWVYPTSYGANEGIVGIWETAANRRSWLVYNNSTLQPAIIIDPDGAAGGGIEALSGIAVSTGQWTHIAGERNGSTLSIYVNGVATGIVTNVSGSVYTNTSDPLDIGGFNSANEFEGYIQDLRIYKGVAKYKGGFDVPKPYTPVGFGTWRAVSDTTANNFATLNILHGSTSGTYTNGNLTIGNPGTANIMEYHPTIGMTQGKWYCEARVDVYDDSNRWHFGVSSRNLLRDASNQNGSNPGDAMVVSHSTAQNRVVNRDHNGDVYYAGSPSDQLVNGDIVGVAVSITTPVASAGAATTNFGTIQFYRNGSTYGDELNLYRHQLPLTGVGGTTPYTREWFFAAHSRFSSQTSVNFGQNPTFSGNINVGVSTFTDSNGKGLFRYEPPTGFLALCEDNLPTPAIADPGEHFKTVLYSGDDNNGHSISGVGFKPDLIWLKGRSGAGDHGIWDTVRGTPLRLRTNTTDSEASNTGILSIDDDGFSLGNAGYNFGGPPASTYVAWCWKAGGAAVSNTDGSITSQVSANQDAGFSIVSYTGNQSAGTTVGHGLGKTPSMIITKCRGAVTSWAVYHKALGATNWILLNSTNATTVSNQEWNDTEPTSSVFTIGNGAANSNQSQPYVAYCWTEIEGFSKFGSYTGNASTDGPFVYCGFKPAWILYKRYDGSSVENWEIFDSSRQSTNPATLGIKANTSDTEAALLSNGLDLLSNGFKIRENATRINASGGTYIFAAFAESPFQTANAK